MKLQLKIIHALHYAPIGGHLDISAITKWVQQLFIWHGLKKYVSAFIAIFSTCQQSKAKWIKCPGCCNHYQYPLHLGK